MVIILRQRCYFLSQCFPRSSLVPSHRHSSYSPLRSFHFMVGSSAWDYGPIRLVRRFGSQSSSTVARLLLIFSSRTRTSRDRKLALGRLSSKVSRISRRLVLTMKDMKLHEDVHSKSAFLCASARACLFPIQRRGTEALTKLTRPSCLPPKPSCLFKLFMVKPRIETASHAFDPTFGAPIPFSEFTLGMCPSVG